MTPKPLADRLLEACEFDELAVEDAAILAGCVKIQAGKPGYHHVDSEYFDEGAKYENARLRPLLEAAAEVVRAASEHVNKKDDCYHEGKCDDMSEALANLNRLLGEG